MSVVHAFGNCRYHLTMTLKKYFTFNEKMLLKLTNEERSFCITTKRAYTNTYLGVQAVINGMETSGKCRGSLTVEIIQKGYNMVYLLDSACHPDDYLPNSTQVSTPKFFHSSGRIRKLTVILTNEVSRNVSSSILISNLNIIYFFCIPLLLMMYTLENTFF